MEMVLVPVADLRLMMIETASIAVRNNLPASQAITPAEKVYTKPEAAEFLHISEQTLNGYVSANKIPFCKPTDGKVYFLHSDLIEWLKKHRTATVDEQAEAYEQNRTTRPARRRSTVTSTQKAA